MTPHDHNKTRRFQDVPADDGMRLKLGRQPLSHILAKARRKQNQLGTCPHENGIRCILLALNGR